MKEIIGIIAVILAVIGVIPYFLDILKGKTKPHLFSWILWTATTFLVFFGQVQKGGGAGTWNTGVVGILSLFITLLTVKKGTKNITRFDKIMFAFGIFSIIPWLLTKDPTLSVVILTGINVSAGLLTIRKTVKNPGTESLILYITNILRHTLSIFAISNYNLATYIFPSALLAVNFVMVFVIYNSARLHKKK
jgi:hypothetical protein